MKNTKLFARLIVAGAMTLMFACKKEPGPGGKAHIEGEVEHDEVKIAGATVSVWYGETSLQSRTADNTTMSDSNGEFAFEGLNKGDYYVSATAVLTDTTGAVETKTAGVAVKIDKKTGDFFADIHLE